MRPMVWCAVVLALLVGPADAGLKLSMWTYGFSELSREDQEDLARYDLVVLNARPENVRFLRARNPEIRILWEIEPQLVAAWDGDRSTWWYLLGDHHWSPARRWQVACHENDWYLRDVSGAVLYDAAGKAFVNWTPYCPRGRTADALGLRASEYHARMLGEIALWRWGHPWGWDRFGAACNGYQFETMVDCWGSHQGDRLRFADPARNGRGAGVDRACSAGGDRQSLSNLMRIENRLYISLLRAHIPSDVVLGMNDVTDWTGPLDREQTWHGIKLENWLNRRDVDGPWTWWDWWSGRRGCGYEWAERHLSRPGVPDHALGWDVSTITVWREPGQSDAEADRTLLLAAGTVLLGDGHLHYHAGRSPVSRYPVSHPLIEELRQLGKPIRDYRIDEVAGRPIYSRRYEGGTVRVDPVRGEATISGLGPSRPIQTIGGIRGR